MMRDGPHRLRRSGVGERFGKRDRIGHLQPSSKRRPSADGSTARRQAADHPRHDPGDRLARDLDPPIAALDHEQPVRDGDGRAKARASNQAAVPGAG